MNAAEFVGQLIRVPKGSSDGHYEWGRVLAVLAVRDGGWRDGPEELLVQFADGSTNSVSPNGPGHGWDTAKVEAGAFAVMGEGTDNA